MRAILEDKDGAVVEVESGLFGGEYYLDSSVHDNVAADIEINIDFTNASGLNDEANLYCVAYDALTTTYFGFRTMPQVHISPSSSGSYFETTGTEEVHIDANDVWYGYSNFRFGNWVTCHETGHAIMWAMNGNAWPSPLGTAPSPHYMNQEEGHGFAWLEGWANIYGAEKDGVPEGTNPWRYDAPDLNLYWAGGKNSDGTDENPINGTDNSGFGVEGAVASAGVGIGFNRVLYALWDRGAWIGDFGDVWRHVTDETPDVKSPRFFGGTGRPARG